MDIEQAQREVRRVYACGFPGLLISSLVWFLSAILGTCLSWTASMWTLIIGGACIFPCLEGLLRIVGHNPSLSRDNPLNPLALQLAFLLPMLLPLVIAAMYTRADWLYPAFMVALGAHFLPFMFLFGMWQFGMLGILFAGSALVFGLSSHEHFVVAGWYGAIVQLLFAGILLAAARGERNSA